MPLTISHPLAIVPIWHLSKKRLDLPALFLGSMIPDLSYYIALRPDGSYGHTLEGVFFQGLPAAFGLLWIFGYIMLQPLRALSPNGLGPILPASYSLKHPRRWLNVALCILIGAASHVFLDSFTHNGWYFVKRWPVLQIEFGLPVYKFLQYGGGVLGLVGLVWLSIRAQRNAPKVSNVLSRTARTAGWSLIFAGIIAVTSLAYGHLPEINIHRILVQSLIGITAGFWWGTLVYSLVFFVLRRRRML